MGHHCAIYCWVAHHFWFLQQVDGFQLFSVVYFGARSPKTCFAAVINQLVMLCWLGAESAYMVALCVRVCAYACFCVFGGPDWWCSYPTIKSISKLLNEIPLNFSRLQCKFQHREFFLLFLILISAFKQIDHIIQPLAWCLMLNWLL